MAAIKNKAPIGGYLIQFKKKIGRSYVDKERFLPGDEFDSDDAADEARYWSAQTGVKEVKCLIVRIEKQYLSF